MLGLPASVKAPALAATGGCAVAQLIAPWLTLILILILIFILTLILILILILILEAAGKNVYKYEKIDIWTMMMKKHWNMRRLIWKLTCHFTADLGKQLRMWKSTTHCWPWRSLHWGPWRAPSSLRSPKAPSHRSSSPDFCSPIVAFFFDYRTQVYLGSDLWVASVSNRPFASYTS